MSKIAFVILAHESADQIAGLARLLTQGDPQCQVIIHYDKNAPRSSFAKLREILASDYRVHLVKDRVRCAWGAFGLVKGVVHALQLIESLNLDIDHVLLLSGSCIPIKPMAELNRFLDAHPKTEFIEAFGADWMVGGLRHERYQYWHIFNHQTQYKLFHYHYLLQRKLWPKRKFPAGLEPRFGSQWWCLTWKTCAGILDYIRKNPRKYRFFKTTWIPDEMFFQTMVFKLIPTHQLANRNLTFYHFNDWGKPLVFLDDHIKLVEGVPFFFARKIAAGAHKIRAHFREVAFSDVLPEPFEIPAEPYKLPYKELVAAQTRAHPLCFPLFQHRDYLNWPAAMDQFPKSFVVLYGPPNLTKRAADALRNEPGMTVLGRIFHPAKVDFGLERPSFHGLKSNDFAIRNMDRPTYLGRILSRIDNLPVIEMAPGDQTDTEIAFMQSSNAIILPIVPAHRGEAWRQLFWALCLEPDNESKPLGTEPLDIYRHIQERTSENTPPDFQNAFIRAIMPEQGEDSIDPIIWKTTMRYRHGHIVDRLMEKLDDVRAAINAVSLQEAIEPLPEALRRSFIVLGDTKGIFQLQTGTKPLVLPPLPELEPEPKSFFAIFGRKKPPANSKDVPDTPAVAAKKAALARYAAALGKSQKPAIGRGEI